VLYVNIAMFMTRDGDDPRLRADYLGRASALIAPGMRIKLFQTMQGSDIPLALPYAGAVNDDRDGGKLRAMCHAAVPNGIGIPVIFCKFFQQIDLGRTVPTSDPQNDGIGWLPYILINTRSKGWRNGVLLHELIHAAYGDHQPTPRPGDPDPHDSDKGSVFGAEDTDVRQPDQPPILTLPPVHRHVLEHAYFTTYAP